MFWASLSTSTTKTSSSYMLARFDRAIAAKEECVASIEQQYTDRETASTNHQLCRCDGALACTCSRKCEDELEEAWRTVTVETQDMREFQLAIHGEW